MRTRCEMESIFSQLERHYEVKGDETKIVSDDRILASMQKLIDQASASLPDP